METIATRPMIQVEGLGQTYQGRNGRIHALQHVTFSVATGEFLSIIGPSGCGKSTLIKIIGDIIQPSEGTIRVNGLTPREARLKGMFSLVFQNPVLLPWRRVLANVLLPLEVLNRNGRDPAALLKMVGLTGFEDHYPSDLSGGMRQRAVLARGLIFDPEILLMDEPFASLDELTRGALNLELIRLWNEIKFTVCFITHSIAEAVFLSDRVLVLSARPARVKDIVTIPFERPRSESLMRTEAFHVVVDRLKAQLLQ